MSSKFNIELAKGTITVEGDQDFIMAVYQALQSTLLSGGEHVAAPDGSDKDSDISATDPAPGPAGTMAAPDQNVTPIHAADPGAEAGPGSKSEEETAEAAVEEAAPIYEPIPSVLDPDRAEREKAEAEAEAEDTEKTMEPSAAGVRQHDAPADRGSVLEQIKESLAEDDETDGQTSILQRIRDSLSEDRAKDGAEETPRAADAS